MRFLSLFSGIGLLDLGLTWAGWTSAGQVEIDPVCRFWLDQHWPALPKWSDVRAVWKEDVIEKCGSVDAVVGGFPCQPHSLAGRRAGKEDERHLWPEFARLVRDLRPSWVLAENVPGLRTTAADEVLGDLEQEGYSAWPLVVGADDVGAPHRRKRVWIVAHRNGGGCGCVGIAERYASGEFEREGAPRHEPHGRGERSVALADASSDALRIERVPGGLEGGEARQAEAQPGGAGARGVGNSEVVGLEVRQRWGQSVREELSATVRAGDPTRGRGWPARPRRQQHGWEFQRLIGDSEGDSQPGVGRPTDGRSRRVARGNAAERRARLRAWGNGVVPQNVEAVAQAINSVVMRCGRVDSASRVA